MLQTLSIPVRRSAAWLALAMSLLLAGCEYDVPISATPTGKLDPRLFGNWSSADGEDKMKIRRWDDSHYVVVYDEAPMRAHHTDVAGTPLVSVQDLSSDDRHFAYIHWKLSGDGQKLTVRVVRSEVIPKEIKSSEEMRKRIEKELKNPELFGDEAVFEKE